MNGATFSYAREENPMRRALAVGLGLAVASAAVMFACGGDDSGSGGAGTSNTGTAGSGSGTAGSGSGTAGSATGAGGSLSGAGGAFDFDAGFDFDALFGSYTCAQLTTCCASLPAAVQADCNMLAAGGDMNTCSAAVSGYKLAGFCK